MDQVVPSVVTKRNPQPRTEDSMWVFCCTELWRMEVSGFVIQEISTQCSNYKKSKYLAFWRIHKQRINKKNCDHVNEIMLFYGKSRNFMQRWENGLPKKLYMHMAMPMNMMMDSDFGYSNFWILQGFWHTTFCGSHHKDQ